MNPRSASSVAPPPAAAVIVAAGKGARMGSAVAKQYLELAGKPVCAHAWAAFEAAPEIGRIVLVLPGEDLQEGPRRIFAGLEPRTPLTVVAGGAQRRESVENGVRAWADSDDETVVLIHDGVRPFVAQDSIRRLIRAALRHGACIPVLPVSETVKRVDSREVVLASPERESLRLAQTPQAFRLGLFRAALQAARAAGRRATDDAALVEALGGRVRTIEGSRFNLKITTPEDLALAAAIAEISRIPREPLRPR